MISVIAGGHRVTTSSTTRSIVINHPAHLARFQTSLDRCLGDSTFVQRFYARFIQADAAIAERFARTDLKKQASVLRASLYLVLRAAQGHPDGLAHLHDVGRTHSARGYGIAPEHYATWLATLIQVAREVDRDLDDDGERAWRSCIEPCIAVIVAAG